VLTGRYKQIQAATGHNPRLFGSSITTSAGFIKLYESPRRGKLASLVTSRLLPI
jgi:hypothetical protein